MAELSELEKRISDALDRVGNALNAPLPAGDDGSAALDEEREANAQLEARLKSVREKAEEQGLEMSAKIAELTSRLSAEEDRAEALARANEELVEAANDGGGPSETEMNAEIEALKAARVADLAEMDAILAEMKPLVGGA